FGSCFLTISTLRGCLLYGLFPGLILSAATCFVAPRLFGGSGQMQTTIRLHGHCELPLLLAIFGDVLGGIGLAWSLVAKIVATSEAASIDTAKSVASVLVGFALVLLIRLVFRLPFLVLGSLFGGAGRPPRHRLRRIRVPRVRPPAPRAHRPGGAGG